MCLYTKQICPLRAKKDIVCYKWVEEATAPIFNEIKTDAKYLTPFYHMPIDVGKTYTVEETKKKSTDMSIIAANYYNARGVYKVEDGYIHCFTKVLYAETAITFNTSAFGQHIIECIIPKGTLYYIEVSKKEIAAKEIHTIRLIK